MYKFFLAIILSTFGALSFAHAEDVTHPWTFSLGGGAMLVEGDKETYSAQDYVARVGYDLNSSFTLEGSVFFIPFQEERDVNGEGFTVMGDNQAAGGLVDMLYHFKPDQYKWDPFAALGGGFIYNDRELADGRFDPLANAGLGLGYSLNDSWGLRADYRAMIVGEDTQFNQSIILSVTYRRGGSKFGLGDSGESPLQTIYFGFDSSALSEEAKAKLRSNADWLGANDSGKVVLEGHCDERGTQDYNYALGERRAKSAFDYLRSLGVPAERMETISYGEDRPADPAHNEGAWSKNRRVVCALD